MFSGDSRASLERRETKGARRITILSGHPAQEPALVDRGGAGHLSERRAEEGEGAAGPFRTDVRVLFRGIIAP